ncbi:PI-PLC X domain-containing protein 3 [Athalia rosae]|uniref:PI-PLC X domain-containing protein 3 n=1 Tax=Athalia rosae TaxID=37344 RepID=UPI00203414E0|nr:PI-PLC X domain-containing protein 3 [Athalia rosae]
MENLDEVSIEKVPMEDVREFYENLESWMSDLPPQLKTLPINHLAIPGSHDSMTYTITKKSKIGPDGPHFLRYLGCLLPVVRPIIFNWSITQHEDVKAQLNGGIRYLDLRVARKCQSDEVCFLHGLYGAPVEQPLNDISDWLSLHPEEVVILDFQHFYEFDDSLHHELIKIIERTFRGKLCPVFSSFSHISLQWLALEKYQVIAIYRNIAVLTATNLWYSNLWITPWPNTVNPGYLVRFLDEELETRNTETGFVSQCLLTPDTYYVARHFFGNLEKDLVNVCRDNILPWIREKKPGSDGLNIVISDFVSYNDFLFSKTVIQRNAELLKWSDKTTSRKYIEVRSKSKT